MERSIEGRGASGDLPPPQGTSPRGRARTSDLVKGPLDGGRTPVALDDGESDPLDDPNEEPDRHDDHPYPVVPIQGERQTEGYRKQDP
jgi:hypothetical protein